jgi:hypothetical protein
VGRSDRGWAVTVHGNHPRCRDRYVLAGVGAVDSGFGQECDGAAQESGLQSIAFPNIDTTGINELRDEYDPYENLIDVHITIAFPVQVDKQALIKHISEILGVGWSPFTVQRTGLHLSID